MNWKTVNSDSSTLFRFNPYVIWKNYTALHCKKSDLITHDIYLLSTNLSLQHYPVISHAAEDTEIINLS